MRSWWERWVRYANRPMDTRPYALLRISICLLVLYDQLQLWWLDVGEFLLYPAAAGGLLRADYNQFHLAWLVGDQLAGPMLWVTVLVCMVLCLLGLVFRPAMLIGLLAYAQLAGVHFQGDRAIDHVLRTALFFLAFSGAAGAWTLSSKKVRLSASWPADCIRVLMVSLYLNAGVVKLFPDFYRWMGIHGDAPVYRSVTQPAIAYLDAVQVEWLMPFWWFASWMTILMEMSSPLLLFKRWRRYWAIHGMALHIGLWMWVDLGIFSVAMLCFYFIILPDETVWLAERVEGLWDRLRGGRAPAAE